MLDHFVCKQNFFFVFYFLFLFLAIIVIGWLLSVVLAALLFYFERIPDDPNVLCLVFTERFNTYYSLGIVFLLVLPANFAVAFIYCRIYHVIMNSVIINIFLLLLDILNIQLKKINSWYSRLSVFGIIFKLLFL